MNKAFVFPGQGSQYIGMGKEFYDNFFVAKQTFLEIDDVLGYKLSKIIFEGPNELLTSTQHAQPAIMAASIAILRVLESLLNKPLNKLCSYVAGHSLGEYSALCAIGALSLVDTTNLLKVRGESMFQSCLISQGSMAACIGIDIANIEKIIEQEQMLNEICQIANDNIENQVVISGHLRLINAVIEKIKEKGYKAIKIPVSGAFHSNLMNPARVAMINALVKVEFSHFTLPIILNVTAKETLDNLNIKNLLVEQITGRVRWRETLERLDDLGVSTIIEIGAGKVLTSMIKKTNHTFKTSNIGNLNELENALVHL